MRSLYHQRIEGVGRIPSAEAFGSPKVEQVERAVELFGLGAAFWTGWGVGSSVGGSLGGLLFGEPYIGNLVGGAVGALLAEAMSRQPRRTLARAVAGRASVTGGARVKAQGHKGAVGLASVSSGGTVRSRGERP